MVVTLRKLENMGTHITIAELLIAMLIGLGCTVIYAAAKAAYETWIK